MQENSAGELIFARVHAGPVFTLTRIQTNISMNAFLSTIDTEMKAKRDNTKSELITFRITKAKAKENSREGGSTEIHLKLAVMRKIFVGIDKSRESESESETICWGN